MTDDLATLPRPVDASGNVRRVGIEVECGGITEDVLAGAVQDRFGGKVRTAGEYDRAVDATELGDFRIHLDTALRTKVGSDLARAGLDLGRAVIPVEFVAPPILPRDIRRIDALCGDIAARGAFGTQSGIVLGFGVHLNVAVAGEGVEDILPVLRAFALVEDWMRGRTRIDAARRVQPFVDTYDTPLLDHLCDPEIEWTMDRLTDLYLVHAGNRNHALDLLPLLMHLDPERVVAALPEMASKSSRPAWHYRLPDCRLNEPGWSIALEWARWCAIERIAADADLVGRLMRSWREYRARILPVPGRWAVVSGEILDPTDPMP